jgi:hypothetical protein
MAQPGLSASTSLERTKQQSDSNHHGDEPVLEHFTITVWVISIDGFGIILTLKIA